MDKKIIGVEPSLTSQSGIAPVLYDSAKEADCPRCHEQCGWCADYRWMHAVLKLPGTRRRCTVPGYEPEGDGCPLCGGKRLVLRTTTYTRLPEPSTGRLDTPESSPEASHP